LVEATSASQRPGVEPGRHGATPGRKRTLAADISTARLMPNSDAQFSSQDLRGKSGQQKIQDYRGFL
jgi:hypothetical protein